MCLAGTSSDAVSGLAGAEFWVEGGGGWQPLEVVDGAWGATWDTTTVPDGTYFVQVRAVDQAGNVGDPAEVFLEVDNQAPVVESAPRATDPEHAHAIAEVQRPGGTDTYIYDASGSQTQRTEGGVTYNQTVDGAGQLITVQNTTSGETWAFTYDGDGERIRQVNPDGTTTLFLAGGLYEVTLDAAGQQTGVKRYYVIGGQTIALRDGSGMFCLLTDHLGSVVAVLDASGAVVGEQRYRPFGQPRLTPGITQTDRDFPVASRRRPPQRSGGGSEAEGQRKAVRHLPRGVRSAGQSDARCDSSPAAQSLRVRPEPSESMRRSQGHRVWGGPKGSVLASGACPQDRADAAAGVAAVADRGHYRAAPGNVRSPPVQRPG